MNYLRNIFIRPMVIVLLCMAVFLPASARGLVTDGKGIWLNVWNYPDNPEMFCDLLESKGIDTVYLQISRSTTPAIAHPKKLGVFIDVAHEHDIKVIGWTYPYLKNPVADANKFIAAARFRSRGGEKLDAVASDIEEVTNSRVIRVYSAVIKRTLGRKYPLIAITFSPLLKRATPEHYAWKEIADNFDIIAPMTYWTAYKKYRSEQGAYNYTALTIKRIREYTGRDDLNIHLIGDGQKTTDGELRGFLKAAEDLDVSGVSIYPWHTPKASQIETLSKSKI